jgi:hypothetical protein
VTPGITPFVEVVRYLAEKRGVESFRYIILGRWAFRLSRRRIRRAWLFFQGEQVQVKLQHWSQAERFYYVEGVRDEWVKVASDVQDDRIGSVVDCGGRITDPNVNKEPLTDEEYDILIKAHGSMGNKWANIVTSFRKVRKHLRARDWASLD